jgi:hypothetical protein
MSHDPIVAEVRANREALLKRFDYDLDALCRYLKDREKKSGRKTVSFEDTGKGRRRRRSSSV